MNQLSTQAASTPLVPTERPRHGLGDVADDWAAVEMWLQEVQAKNHNGSTKTVDTYRFHLAKLRWYCENVLRIMPAAWTTKEVKHFREFLAKLPDDALCAHGPAADKRSAPGTKRFVDYGEPGWTPFRKQPSVSSQSDILRFTHALFSAWQAVGYVPWHPMALSGAPRQRKVNVSRAISLDLYDLVLDGMEQEPKSNHSERQRYLRDKFIFLALRWLGLRSSELVGARMGAFNQVTMPKSGERYWIFTVTEETAKGAVERHLPVVRELWKAFLGYRVAFGLTPTPAEEEGGPLLLSMRTKAVAIAGQDVMDTASRRFFGAWRSIETRQGLYGIVKERLRTTAGVLRDRGNVRDAERLASASSHWLRHTFGKAALLAGQNSREVMAAMGHADDSTTARYTVQDALDLITAWEREKPGCVAKDKVVA